MNGHRLTPVTRPVGAMRRRDPARAPSAIAPISPPPPPPSPSSPIAAPGDQAAGLRRLIESMGGVATATPDAPTLAPRIARSVAFASGKGGVGKSTICVNVAAALANAGVRTTLLDGDLGLANADVLCGVSANGHLGHVIRGERTFDEVLLDAPGGFRLVPGASGIAELADLPPDAVAALVRGVGTLERACDMMLIDCGAGISRGVLGLVCAADAAVLVVTPEPTSITDAYALLKCAVARLRERDETPRIALFINQATDEAEANRVADRIRGVSEKFLGLSPRMIGWAPIDDRVRHSVRLRRPIVLAEPDAPAARAVRRLAGEIGRMYGHEEVSGRPEGSGGRTGASGLVRRLLGFSRS